MLRAEQSFFRRTILENTRTRWNYVFPVNRTVYTLYLWLTLRHNDMRSPLVVAVPPSHAGIRDLIAAETLKKYNTANNNNDNNDK